MDDRRAMQAIVHVLRRGIPWKALPAELGAASTVYDRYKRWRDAGVFERLWVDSLIADAVPRDPRPSRASDAASRPTGPPFIAWPLDQGPIASSAPPSPP